MPTATPPVFAASPGAGTGATGVCTGSDSSGRLTVTTGLAPVLGDNIGAISFNQSFLVAPQSVILTPANSAAALVCVNVWVPTSAIFATFFRIKNTGIALLPSIDYIWYFVVNP